MRSLFLLFIILIMNSAFGSQAEYVEVQGTQLKDPFDQTVTSTKEDEDPNAILTALPNITSASGSNRPRFFQIRGIGESSQFEHSQVNAVGVFYEGIDLSEEASTLPLLGLEILNVGYGPQNLNWGSKAFAGSVEASSCLGGVCPRGHWAVGAGNYRTYSLRGGSVVSSPKVSLLVGAGLTTSDGFIENQFLGRPSMKVDEKEAVVGLTYTLGEVKVRQHHLVSMAKNGYDAWAFTPSYDTQSDRPGQDRFFVHGHSLALQLPVAGLQLHSLTSATVAQQLESYDEDWGNDPFWNSVPGWNTDYDYFAEFDRRRLKLHQKLYAQTSSGLKWGLHWSSYRENQIVRSIVDGNLRKQSEPEFSTRSTALFAEQLWQLGEWSFGAGARVETQHAKLGGIGPGYSQSMAPQWSLDLKTARSWTAEWSSQMRLRRGYRGGGFNTSATLPSDLLSYGPEQLYVAELGMAWQTPALTAAIQFFHQWQEHAQTRSSIQEDPTDPDTFTYFTANTSGMGGQGAEVSVARPWHSWRFTGNAGFLKNRYHDYKLGKRDLGGREVEQSPSWTAMLRAEFNPKPWGFMAQATGRDGYYHSIDHDFQSKPYTLVDGSVSYAVLRWEFRAWVKNAFDKRYPVRAYYFANEPPDWFEKFYEQLGPPRTFGLQAIYEY